MCLSTPLLPKTGALQVASGLDILHLAFIRGQFWIARDIMNHQDADRLLGRTDDGGNSHLMILCMFDLNEEIRRIISETPIINEFLITPNGLGPLQVCARMGRFQYLKLFLQLLNKTC